MPAEDVSKDGGVLKEIIKEGTGDEYPTSGSEVTVHYTGTLLDGTKFDSSKDRNEPFKFNIGNGQVIKAWDIGIRTMKRGEVAVLTCSPDYAYGKMGSPPKIPPDATLKFEVEMIDWSDDLSPYKDKGIERIQLAPGKGFDTPKKGSLVDVHLIGKYNNEIFEERDVQFYLGEGENDNVIEGVETALEAFQTGEKSRLKIKSKYAFKSEGKPEWNVPPNADVEYIVELKSFERPVETWSLSLPELVEHAKTYKEKGTNAFKESKYHFAIKMYSKVTSLLENTDSRPECDENVKAERDNLLLTSHLNLALCYLKTDQNVQAKDSCDKVLEMSPRNEKALFRRGQAYLALAFPEVAVKDFQEVQKIEPKNAAAAKQIIVCNNLIKKQLAIEKKLYANMFEKFAQEDKQKEEEELRQQPDVMLGALGEWGQEERPGGRDATAFEKENPNILMLNANGTGEFQNM